MKILFVLTLFFPFSSIVNGQTQESDTTLNNVLFADSIPVPCDCEFCVVVDPSFPGGENALSGYLRANSQFTQEMIDLKLSGIVYVQFVVELDGSITQVEVIRGLHKAYDKKAIEIISSMPKWSPGKDACGKFVRVRYIVPIKFDSN